ncbi:MAG: hypothetical protein QNK37_21145 [Acidobacteriota bacterium]|nr:hypothetical protein [Acidobacteriota bacterium]
MKKLPLPPKPPGPRLFKGKGKGKGKKRPEIPEHIYDEMLCLELADGAYLNCGKIEADWDELTVEAWVFPRNFNHHCLMSHDMSVTLHPGGMHVHTRGDDAPLTADFNIPENTWSHVAVTVDKDGKHRYYHNGRLKLNLPGNKLSKGKERKLLIGRPNRRLHKDLGEDDLQFEGKLGSMAIWSKARKQAEILADMVFTPLREAKGLVGCWMMEEVGRSKGDRLKKIQDISLPNPNHAKVKRGEDEDADAELVDAQIPRPDNTDMVEFGVDADEIGKEGVFEYVPDWCEEEMLADMAKYGASRDQLYKCAGNIDEIGLNADDDTYTMGTSLERLLLFNATAHDMNWETRLRGFYMKELYCADGDAGHEDPDDDHVLEDLAYIEDGRWMVARTGEEGAIEYLVLIYMKHRKTGEERWVAWDPIIKVGTDDPTDG